METVQETGWNKALCGAIDLGQGEPTSLAKIAEHTVEHGRLTGVKTVNLKEGLKLVTTFQRPLVEAPVVATVKRYEPRTAQDTSEPSEPFFVKLEPDMARVEFTPGTLEVVNLLIRSLEISEERPWLEFVFAPEDIQSSQEGQWFHMATTAMEVGDPVETTRLRDVLAEEAGIFLCQFQNWQEVGGLLVPPNSPPPAA